MVCRELRAASLALLLVLALAPESSAQVACSTSVEPQSVTQVPALFYSFKPGTFGTFRHRDLEFHWDALYDVPGTIGLSYADQQTLRRLGMTLAELPGDNPFGANLSDIHLVYEYFRVDTSMAYSNDPFSPSGLMIGRPTFSSYGPGGSNGISPTPLLDRGHVDHYVYKPGHMFTHAEWPSEFYTAKEDSSTGWWQSPSSWTAWTGNSLMTPAFDPATTARVDSFGTGWARPGGSVNLFFNHEFQHAMPKAGPTFTWHDEVFSTGVESVAGSDEINNDEVPYTWSLTVLNYQNWPLLTAYLAYNYRGTDTTATLGGFADDLLLRWARGDRRYGGLRNQLSNANCPDCALKPYFRNAQGDPLPLNDRLNILLHHWRTANYVNNDTLDAKQYGYPPQFHFSPTTHYRAWQSTNGIPGDDPVAIPPEVVARPQWAFRETTMVGIRYPSAALRFGSIFAPMQLSSLGSEYWVVRSDPSLASSQQALVVRILPEGISRGRNPADPCFATDGRLTGSVILYSVPADSLASGRLWAHPEWARRVLSPRWVDADSLRGPVEFVVDGFGSAFNAAVVVISLGDGPSEGVGKMATSGGSPMLPYRLNLSLRTALSPALTHVSIGASLSIEDQPAWAPGGKEVLFTRTNPATGIGRIYRDSVFRFIPAPPALLTPGTENQGFPDWSPRGDWVAFAQDSGTTGLRSDIWMYNTWTGGSAQRLTFRQGRAAWPAFQPNGQRLAYACSSTVGIWELRRVDLNGSNDTALLGAGNAAAIRSVRWSPDGLWIYFSRNDTLYAIGKDGGPVFGRQLFIARAASLDFHRGGERPVAEEPRTFTWLACGIEPPIPMPVRRVVFRDSLNADSEPRSYRTGASYYNPRWSVDGTAIAYASDEYLAGSRDLFIDRITHNRAPAFFGLPSNLLAYQGQAFELQLNANDPDGEAVHYRTAATFLPSASTFDQLAGRFTWANPQPVGAEFFLVFRAVDGSGGVAEQVVRLTVEAQPPPPPPGGGGCPFVDTRTATGWEEENSVLGRSLEGTLVLDPYRLRFLPDARDGRVAIRLRENEQEFTTLDQVSLVALDHPPDVRAYAVRDRFFLATRLPAHRVTTSAGRDITSLVSGTGSHYWGSPGDTLLVEMNADRGAGSEGIASTQDGGGGEGGMEGDPKETEKVPGAALPVNANAVDAGVLSSTGILVQAPDGGGGWRTLAHYYPRRYRDETVVDSLGQGSCRLVFVGRHRLHFVGRYVHAASAATPQVLPLLAARHSRLGDARSAVAQRGGTTTMLIPGDTLTMEFTTSAVPLGQVRDYVLVSRGVYSSEDPRGQGQIDEPGVLPAQFHLAQNQPNPFSQATDIRFALPVPVRVRLVVFDLQGRRIAVLADGEFPAGYHVVSWGRRDATGVRVRPGVYLYRLEAGSFHDEKKAAVLR